MVDGRPNIDTAFAPTHRALRMARVWAVAATIAIFAAVVFGDPALAGDRKRDHGDNGGKKSRENEDRHPVSEVQQQQREEKKSHNDNQFSHHDDDHQKSGGSSGSGTPVKTSDDGGSTASSGSGGVPAGNSGSGSQSVPGGTTGSSSGQSSSGQSGPANGGGSSSPAHGGSTGSNNSASGGSGTANAGGTATGNSSANGNSQNTSSAAGTQNSGTDTPSAAGHAPATVEQWLRNLGKPPKEPAAPVRPAAVKIPALKRQAGTHTGAADLSFPALARPEVLAVNVSKATLSRARTLGFTDRGAMQLSNLNYAVTRLQVPAGMSAGAAEALLNKEQPGANVSANRKYRMYRTATGAAAQTEEVAAVSAAPGGTVSCGLDHCFARDIVGWKPALRSCVTSGLRIGVIDTSVDVTHPALARRKIVVQHLGPSGSPGPNLHGTGVTALLAGDSSSGTPGLIPDASFFVADVFYADSDSQPASDTVSMLRAFDWLQSKNVKIVNMSLTGPADPLIAQAIEKMSAKGVIFVAAAGNDGPTAAPSFPAAYDKVIAVTAVGQNLQNYRYANRGSYIDVAAPGVAIWTALPGSKEGYHSGTSFAAPYVTAALAAIYPLLPANDPARALKHLGFRDLGAPGPDPIYGRGLLIAPSSCAPGAIAAAPPKPAVPTSKQASTASGLISAGAASFAPPPASSPIPASTSTPAFVPAAEQEILPWALGGASN